MRSSSHSKEWIIYSELGRQNGGGKIYNSMLPKKQYEKGQSQWRPLISLYFLIERGLQSSIFYRKRQEIPWFAAEAKVAPLDLTSNGEPINGKVAADNFLVDLFGSSVVEQQTSSAPFELGIWTRVIIQADRVLRFDRISKSMPSQEVWYDKLKKPEEKRVERFSLCMIVAGKVRGTWAEKIIKRTWTNKLYYRRGHQQSVEEVSIIVTGHSSEFLNNTTIS